MSDQMVLKAQKYLNSMYGGHSDWVTLEENGNTGTLMIEGLVRAFQIQNNVPNITGYLGSYTVNVMKLLSNISKMNVDDDSNPNVCLIQCASFCKGYNAGGITGIYYTTGVRAVKQLQEDANISITGIIDWKVWVALFSMYWFELVSGGDEKIRTIQRQINADYSDSISVQACDGVMSRNTALSLLGALQVAEGLVSWIDDLSSLNFGPSTTNAFPILKQGQDGVYIKYNKLAQYALYFNGINQNKFDGIYDSDMTSNIVTFQHKYGLTGNISDTLGTIEASTMKSLLTSKGDTNRLSLGCDCSTILSLGQAEELYAAGYRYVGRYLTGTVGFGINKKSKALTVSEIKNIQNVGLSIFPIYQDGGYYADYFSQNLQGSYDAVTAINKAKQLGFVNGTVIYFAVDFDCLDYQTENLIIPYFQQIKNVFNHTNINSRAYKIGIYAPRYVCTRISENGYADYSFAADMSTGFSGNLGYAIPNNWAFDQFYEYDFSSSPSFALDKVAVSGKDNGCRNCDIMGYDLLNSARFEYVNRFLKNMKYLDYSLEFDIDFDQVNSFDLGTVSAQGFMIHSTLNISDTIKIHPDSTYKIHISCDESGSLSNDTIEKIKTITNIENYSECNILMMNMLMNAAESLQVGDVMLSASIISSTSFKVYCTVETDDLKTFADVAGVISLTLEFDVYITDGIQSTFILNSDALQQSTIEASTTMVITVGFLGLLDYLYDMLFVLIAV